MKSKLIKTEETGAAVAEYAVCGTAGVGFAAMLFKMLTSDVGQKILGAVFDGLLKLLPF